MDAADAAFYDQLVGFGIYSNRRNLARYVDVMFGDVDVAGRRVLDIGGGSGIVGFSAAHRGAEHVLVLEPELAGSTSGITERFRERAKRLGFEDRCELERATIQDFDPADRRYEVVVSAASINHWNEPACIVAHEDEAAREEYRVVLRKIAGMTAPGGVFIATDVDRRNLFGDLGLKNPMSPDIEWEKHQSPWFWAKLCEESGFERPKVQWTTFNTLGAAGGRLLDNRLAAYLTMSSFRLQMHRPA